MTSWPQHYEIIISDIVPNGSRPNVATNIGTTTCAVASPIDRGSETRRALRREERSTRGHRVCSRSSDPVTGSWGCVARRTIVSEPPTSTAPKDWANGTTPSTRMRSWRCSPIVGAEVDRTVVSGYINRPCWRTCRNGRPSPTFTPNEWCTRTGWPRVRWTYRKGDARCTCFIRNHGCTMETSLHVHRRRTDGVQQEYFRDAYVASRCCDDRSTARKNNVVLRRMARGLRNDGLGPRAFRGRVTDGGHVRFDNEEPHRHRRSHGWNGRTGHDLVH